MKNKKVFIVVAAVVLIIIAVLVIVNLNKSEESQTETESETQADTETQEKKYTSQQWREYAIAYYEEATGNTPADVKLYSDGTDIMIIEFYDNADDTDYVQKYNLDYKTGIGTDLQGNTVDLNME